MSTAGVLLNMLGISYIIWGDGNFEALKMGLMIGFRTWGIAIAGILFGKLADKYPRKPLLILAFFIAGLGRFLNGFSPENAANSYEFFIFCYVFSGVGQGGIQPLIISYSNDSIPQDQRSQFFGKLESLRQIFQILGTIGSSWLIQTGYWRLYFWFSGISILIGMGLVIFFLPEPKRGAHSHQQLSQVLSTSNVEYKFDLNLETFKKTVFSKTNIIAFVEGIQTWILFSVALYMLYPYLQSPPYNISAFASSILMIFFGLPGAVIGSIGFSKLSDRLAKKDILNRVYLIIFSILFLFFSIISVFLVPIPELTPAQGDDIGFLVQFPQVWILGFLIFMIRGVLGIYNINQNPIIQKINLPEAQGLVSSWNQFLETVGHGLGPIIAGFFLEQFAGDYTTASFISILIGVPSAFLWLLARKWIHQDIKVIEEILKTRAETLSSSQLEQKD